MAKKKKMPKKKKFTKKEQGMLRSAYRRAHAEKGIQRIREQHRPGGVKSVLTRTNTDPLLQKG